MGGSGWQLKAVGGSRRQLASAVYGVWLEAVGGSGKAWRWLWEAVGGNGKLPLEKGKNSPLESLPILQLVHYSHP